MFRTVKTQLWATLLKMQVLSRCILAPFPCPPQPLDQFVVQLLSRVQLFATSWTAARQVSLSFAISEPKESESEVAQSCPTLCDPMDCSLPGSSVHGIFQATGLEWGAIAFSAGALYSNVKPQTRTSPEALFATVSRAGRRRSAATLCLLPATAT